MENDADKFDFVRPLAAENDPVVPVGNGIAAADIVPVKGTDKRELIPVKQAIDIDAPKRERGGIQKHALDFLKKMGVAFSIASALTSSPSADRFHRDMNAPARRNHAGDEEAWENVRFGRRKQEVEDSSDGLQQAIPHYDKGGQVDRSSQAGSDSGVFRKIKSISDRIGSGVKTAAGATSKAVRKTATIFSIASALSGWGDLSPVAASVAAASDSAIPREVQIGSHWLDHDRRRKAVESRGNPKVAGKAGESVDDLVMHYEKGGQVSPDSDSGVFQKTKSISGSLGSGVKSAAETASKAVKKTATAFSIVSALSGWGDMSTVAASSPASADSSAPREVAIATHWLGHDRRRKSAETKESPKAFGKAADGIGDPVDHYDKGGPVVADLVPAKSRTAESADPVSDGGTDGGFQNDAHREWFGNSKITDESGKPLTLHHGTTSDFDVFDTSRSQLGSHFGTRSQAEGFARGKDNGKVHDVTLRMENPLRLRDHGRWYWPDVTQELKEKGIDVPDELEKEYQEITKENLIERMFRGVTGSQMPSKKAAIAKWTTKNLQDVIKKSGHDGVVYRNDFEGLDTVKFQEAKKERGFQYGSQEYEDALKEFGASDSYIAFDPTQIKSRKNAGTFNPEDPSIHREDGGEIPIHPDVPADADEVPIKAKAGEFIVRKEQTQKFKPLLEAINDDRISRSAVSGEVGNAEHFEDGGEVVGGPVAERPDEVVRRSTKQDEYSSALYKEHSRTVRRENKREMESLTRKAFKGNPIARHEDGSFSVSLFGRELNIGMSGPHRDVANISFDYENDDGSPEGDAKSPKDDGDTEFATGKGLQRDSLSFAKKLKAFTGMVADSGLKIGYESTGRRTDFYKRALEKQGLTRSRANEVDGADGITNIWRKPPGQSTEIADDADHFQFGGEVPSPGDSKPKRHHESPTPTRFQHGQAASEPESQPKRNIKSFFDFESDTEHLPPRVREKAYAHYVSQQNERESLTPEFAKKEFRENKPEDFTQYNHAKKERESGFYEAREKWNEQHEIRRLDKISQAIEKANPQAFDDIVSAIKRNELSTSEIIHRHLPEEFRNGSSSDWIAHLRASSRKAQDDELPLTDSDDADPSPSKPGIQRERAKEPWELTRNEFAANAIPAKQSSDMLRAINGGDERSKRAGKPLDLDDFTREAMVQTRLPLSMFPDDVREGLADSTNPDRVQKYATQQIDTPVHAVPRRGRGFGIMDGGHRTMAAIARGDESISAMVPASSHREIVASAIAAGKPVPPEVLAGYPELRSQASGEPPVGVQAKPKDEQHIAANRPSSVETESAEHVGFAPAKGETSGQTDSFVSAESPVGSSPSAAIGIRDVTEQSGLRTEDQPRPVSVPAPVPAVPLAAPAKTEPGIDSPTANRSQGINPDGLHPIASRRGGVNETVSNSESPTSIQAATGQAATGPAGKPSLSTSAPAHASDLPVKSSAPRGKKDGSGWALSEHPGLQSDIIDAIRSGKSPSEVHAMIPADLRSSSTPALIKQMFMMNGGAESPRRATKEPHRGETPEPPAQSGENPSLSTDVKPAAPSLLPEAPLAKPQPAESAEPADDWRAEWKRANAARQPVQEQGGASFADLQKKSEADRITAMYAEAAARREAKQRKQPNSHDTSADTFHKATPQQSENINSHIAKGESVVGDVFGHSEPKPKKSPVRGGGGYDSPKKPGGDDAAAKAERDSTIARLNKSREAERDAENKQRVFDTKRHIAQHSGIVDFDDHFESVRGEINKVIDDVGQQPPLASGKKRYFHGGQKIDAGDDHMLDVFTPSVEEAAYAAMLAERPVSYVDLDEEKTQNLSRNYHADPNVTQSSTVLFDTFDAKKNREDDTPVARSRFTPTTPQEPLPSRAKSRSSVTDDADVPTALRADGIPGDSAPIATETKTPAKKEATPRAKRKVGRAETASEVAPQGPAGDANAPRPQPKRPAKTMIASGEESAGSTRDDDSTVDFTPKRPLPTSADASIPTALRADGVAADSAPIATAAPAATPTATPAPGEKPKTTTKSTPANVSETDRLSWKMNQRFDLSQMLQAGAYATDLIGGGSKSKGPTGWGSTKEDGDFYQAVYGKSMPRGEERGPLSGASDYLRKGAALTSGGGMDWMFGDVGSKGLDGMLGGASKAMRGILGGGEDDPRPGGGKGGDDGTGKMVGKIATTAAKFAFPEAAPLIAMAEKTGIVDKLFSSEGGGMFGGGGGLGGTLGGLLGGGDGKDGRDGKDETGSGEVAKLLRELIDIIKGQGKAGEQSTGYGNTQSHPSLNLSIPGLINAIGLMANAPRG